MGDLSGVIIFFLYRFNHKKLDPLIDFINPEPNHQFWEVAKGVCFEKADALHSFYNPINLWVLILTLHLVSFQGVRSAEGMEKAKELMRHIFKTPHASGNPRGEPDTS